MRQRIFHCAGGYADGNDANSLRFDPVFKLAAERAPLDADTHIVLRGDGHFSNPELMALCESDDHLDFIFG